ncbi:hypothetical protein VPHK24_0072 [Vibrio phage K24]
MFPFRITHSLTTIKQTYCEPHHKTKITMRYNLRNKWEEVWQVEFIGTKR